jgi:hypothetical protein
VNLAGKGEASNPARPRTVSAASTQTPTATSLATRRPVGYCPWCAPPQDAWPRGARPARDLEGRDQDEALSGGDGRGGPGKRGSGQGARHLLRCLGASVHAAASWRTAGVSSAQAMPSQTPANILECGALASLWVFQPRVRWKPMRANTPTAPMAGTPTRAAVAAASLRCRATPAPGSSDPVRSPQERDRDRRAGPVATCGSAPAASTARPRMLRTVPNRAGVGLVRRRARYRARECPQGGLEVIHVRSPSFVDGCGPAWLPRTAMTILARACCSARWRMASAVSANA